MPIGQYGTRHMAGKDAAQPRYIQTKLNIITRFLFHEDDDHVVDYIIDEGLVSEPKFYVPVIPLLLCNGAVGIGTGWSTKIPNYNPRDIVDNLKRKIDG